MTSEAFRGSWLDAYLDAITAEIGVEQRIGAAEDARIGAPPRMVWVPPKKGALQIRPAPFARAGEDVVVWAEARFDVSIWADSYGAAYDLYTALWTALDSLFGPPAGRPAVGSDPSRPGYDLGDPSDLVIDERVAGSVALTAPATIRSFVDRGQFATSRPIEEVPTAVALGATPDDATPETATEQVAA
jgi:hypothetical protein